MLAYAGKTGRAGMREKENGKQTEKGEREREEEIKRDRESQRKDGTQPCSRWMLLLIRLWDFKGAGWIYLDIPAGASARGSMSPLPRLRSSVSLFFGVH